MRDSDSLRITEFGSTESLGVFDSSNDRLSYLYYESKRAAAVAQAAKRRKPFWVFLSGIVALVAVAGVVIGVLVVKHFSQRDTHNKTDLNASPRLSSAASASTALSRTGTASLSRERHTTPTSIAAKTAKTASTRTTHGKQSATTSPSATAAACSTKKDIPAAFKGTYNDPTTWLDMTDFNCTFTSEMVGNLPIVGLNSTWDDSKQANPNVPALDRPWGSYSNNPIRAVNLGGWFSLEPFITPSLFDYDPSLGIVDEYTLCSYLGPQKAAAALEQHYATFLTEQDFFDIAAAGLSHVRIPFSYWSVTTYSGDPYVLGVSWRYLLRAIEWARKHGLRVNLDLHAVPGSQNGWNHSGRSGAVNWIIGNDGSANAERSLDIHDRLSKFFAQKRYRNVVAFYGLVNEPATTIPQNELAAWTASAIKIVSDNGFAGTITFSEALRGLPAWQGELQGYGNSLVIDVHEYVIFDPNLLVFEHSKKVSFVCSTFESQIQASMNTATGFGPTMVGEWSQADTDCAKWLNGIGNGARWAGNFSGKSAPSCPTGNSQCSCTLSNQPVTSFSSDFKAFLLSFAEAQMSAYESGWGWFYWTWKTESAPLWSYQAGLQGGFMPPVACERSWSCSDSVPSFGSLPEFY